MASGLFASDCSSTDWAWISWADPGCLLQGVGSSTGAGVTSALEPVWYLLIFAGILVVVILLIVGFAPNVKHIIPHFV